MQEILTENGTMLVELDTLAFGRGPGNFAGVRIGIGIVQGLALGAELPMIGVLTPATVTQGTWRKTGVTHVLATIGVRMDEVYWTEYQRDKQGARYGEETETVFRPETVAERLAQLSGKWATVSIGWQVRPNLAKVSGLTLSSGEIELLATEGMLPSACYLLTTGKIVAVERVEPVYLRNEAMWKRLPGREWISVTRRLRRGAASWRVKNRVFAGCQPRRLPLY